MEKNRTRIVKIGAGILALAVAAIVGVLLYRNSPCYLYKQAIFEIEFDETAEALALLERTGNYKNSPELRSYCWAYLCYGYEQPENYDKVQAYLNEIPAEYSGDCADEVSTLRYNLQFDQQSYAEELFRQSVPHEVSSAIPQVGMDEQYIKYTILGDYQDETPVTRDGVLQRQYSWISDKGDLYFIAFGDGEQIVEVEKKNMNLYWYRDYFYPQGFPDTEKEETPALQPYHRETYETETDDEFDADSYSNPEDFYYDYYDDFYDYEDAEDYWEENS